MHARVRSGPVSDIPFITSYYFPLSPGPAAENILFHCPIFALMFLSLFLASNWLLNKVGSGKT